MTAATWQRLSREARAARRGEPGAPSASLSLAPIMPAVAPRAVVLPAAVDDPAAVAARVAAVAAASPRLHARIAALDPAQQAAVVTDDRSALVRAGVGSGKTTTLVHRAAYLHVVEGVPLDAIAMLTFTTKAAAELEARLDDVLGRTTTARERWLVGTFHAVALALLERALPLAEVGLRPGLTILDDAAVAALLDELATTHKLRVGTRRRLRDRLRRDADDGPLAALAARFAEAKRARNAVEFDELIEHATALLAAPAVARPRWILVDELQDCEPRELALVERLRGDAGGFFGVGDPRQAIYGWRGGLADGFARAAAALGCAVRELPASYRSTRTILDGAQAVLGAQPVAGGELAAVRPAGAPIAVRRHHDPVAEAAYLAGRLAALAAAGVPRGELAVLCRLRAQVEALAAALVGHGVPCAVDADAPVVGAVDAVAAAPADAVRVMTMHAAKGLEFRHVFIAGANLGVLPLVLWDRSEDEAEERRLLFVGLTRARDEVEVSYVACPHVFGALGAPSPLLYLLPADAVAWVDGPARGAAAAGAEPAVIEAAAVEAAAPSVEVAAVAPVPVAVAAASAPWQIGQAVRHARYGAGVVTAIDGDTVACSFGKLGDKTFPLRMCPLTAVASGSAP